MSSKSFDQTIIECRQCDRLVSFLESQRESHSDWWNRPVPSFGPLDAKMLILGLAPGLKGANHTGRPFTGDYAGDLLYDSLLRHGLAEGKYGRDPADGLKLKDVRISNAVRCVPPQNKPLTAEIHQCRPHLHMELSLMPKLRVILALGGIAWQSLLRAFEIPLKQAPFGHGVSYETWHSPAAKQKKSRLILLASYHCSRYNTQTGRLTTAMFDEVITQARDLIRSQP